MAIKKIKKDYHSREEIPANIKKDFEVRKNFKCINHFNN